MVSLLGADYVTAVTAVSKPWNAIALVGFVNEAGERRFKPVVLAQCVGCGVCEMICPAEPAAIVIDAQAVWKEGA